MQSIFQPLHLTPHPRCVKKKKPTCMTHSNHTYSTVSAAWTLKVNVSDANAYVKQVLNLSWQAHVVGQQPRREVIKWEMHRGQRTAAHGKNTSIRLHFFGASQERSVSLENTRLPAAFTRMNPCGGFRVEGDLNEADDKCLIHMEASAQVWSGGSKAVKWLQRPNVYCENALQSNAKGRCEPVDNFLRHLY